MVIIDSIPSQDSDQKPIYARSGWEIPLPEKMPLQKAELVQIRTESLKIERRKVDRSDLVIRSISPYPYNCVGMIFASRRVFIDIDHIYEILHHDGYRTISIQELMAGDIVLYKNFGEPSHVAVVINVYPTGTAYTIKVISKWGLDGEMIHLMENIPPQLGEPLEFYTERQT